MDIVWAIGVALGNLVFYLFMGTWFYKESWLEALGRGVFVAIVVFIFCLILG